MPSAETVEGVAEGDSGGDLSTKNISQKGNRSGAPSSIGSKDNPASDPRKMRRIIAEDPEWSLAVVPLLGDICINNIVKNFAEEPVLDELLPKHRQTVLSKLSTDLPLKVTANLIGDEDYWKRCCLASWNVCDVSDYDGSWKQMFFERKLQRMIENFVPGSSNMTQVDEFLTLASSFTRRLNIQQLLPPVREVSREDDFSEMGSEAGDIPDMDHFDFGPVMEKLPYIKEFSVAYGVKDCGMNFEWNLFLFTARDCLLLSTCLKKVTHLNVLRLHHSKLDDDKARVLVSHLLDHPSLTELDLSCNKVSDSGARAIGKLVNRRSQLVTLKLLDNRIGSQGVGSIAFALTKNTTLKSLNLRLNRINDEGCQTLCKALLRNTTLVELNIAANNITEPTAAHLAQVLIQNKTLESIDLTSNRIGPDGGKQLQEAMEENQTITQMDLRLTEAGQESEYCINQILENNRNLKCLLEEESQNQSQN